MTETPLVTIYIVSYRKFQYYRRAIESALNQDYENIEIIISDDGSCNYPIEDVKVWTANPRQNIKSITVLNNECNVGTVRHENNLLEYAHGVIYMPLAADDQLYDNHVVSQIVERFKTHPFHVLSVTRACFNESDQFLCFYPHILDRNYIYTKMGSSQSQFRHLTEVRARSFASGSAMIYNADFFKKMEGFDERYVLWEDGPFLNKMTSRGYSVDFAYDIIYLKYHTGGISSNKNELLLKDEAKFNSSDRIQNKNEYGILHKRRVSFWSKVGTIQSKILRLCYYFLYPEIIVDRFFTTLRTYCYIRYDRFFYTGK